MLYLKQVAILDQCVRPPFVIGFDSMRSAGLRGDREQLKFWLCERPSVMVQLQLQWRPQNEGDMERAES